MGESGLIQDYCIGGHGCPKVEESPSAGPCGSRLSASEMLLAAKNALGSGRIEEASALVDDDLIEAVQQTAAEANARKHLVVELAGILLGVGREQQAEQCYRRALELGAHGAAYDGLARLYECKGQICEAVECEEKALESEPDQPQLWANLARLLVETGRIEEGIDLLREAVESLPADAQVHSNLLFHLHHLPVLDRSRLFAEHKRWARIHAADPAALDPHGNVPDPDRKLKIGYISPDFRRHSVSYFFESLLDGHDRAEFEIYGYGNVEFPDEVTERLREKFDSYKPVRGLSDNAVAARVREDGIDVLVDLAGHSGGNRLPVLARKPAPVQVTYLGYPDTTGLEAVDYRLADRLAEPPDSQKFNTEELYYLPDGFLCYRPANFAPEIAPLPADKKGHITFGSFNHNCKINDLITRIWADVLKATGDSRLLLKLKGADHGPMRERYLKMFEQWGVGADRIEICGWVPPQEHLRLYSRVDIALDTYPYNGTTTTCEALWMGVPVISLVGSCHVSRVALSILTRMGLEFFVASEPDEYVSKAAALAGNRSALAQLRKSMRARMATCGLCHARGFARDVEAAYRRMWRRWCRARSRHGLAGRCSEEIGL